MKDEIREILDRLEYDKDDVYYVGYTDGVNIDNTLMPKDIKLLLDYITNLQEIADVYNKKYREVKMLKEQLLYEKENTKVYKSRIENVRKDIQHELSHLKANDEISWNKKFYTNDKLDYRKLCIALLEQVVNKLKEKE